MEKEKFSRRIQSEVIKSEQSIYGLDEICLIYAYFGKDSEIFKAMANGQEVSAMLEKLIKEQMVDIEKKKRLLEMCKQREKLVEESRTQTL